MSFILSMEETLRTSEEGFISIDFVKLCTMNVLEKRRKALSFDCAEIFTKCNLFTDT